MAAVAEDFAGGSHWGQSTPEMLTGRETTSAVGAARCEGRGQHGTKAVMGYGVGTTPFFEFGTVESSDNLWPYWTSATVHQIL